MISSRSLIRGLEGLRTVLVALVAAGFLGTASVGYEVAEYHDQVVAIQQERQEIRDLQKEVEEFRVAVSRPRLDSVAQAQDRHNPLEGYSKACVCVLTSEGRKLTASTAASRAAGVRAAVVAPVRPHYLLCPTKGEVCDEDEARRCSEEFAPNYAC